MSHISNGKQVPANLAEIEAAARSIHDDSTSPQDRHYDIHFVGSEEPEREYCRYDEDDDEDENIRESPHSSSTKQGATEYRNWLPWALARRLKLSKQAHKSRARKEGLELGEHEVDEDFTSSHAKTPSDRDISQLQISSPHIPLQFAATTLAMQRDSTLFHPHLEGFETRSESQLATPRSSGSDYRNSSIRDMDEPIFVPHAHIHTQEQVKPVAMKPVPDQVKPAAMQSVPDQEPNSIPDHHAVLQSAAQSMPNDTETSTKAECRKSLDTIHPVQSADTSKKTNSRNVEQENVTCFICMRKFTEKRPKITLPCSASCNSAPVHAKCIYDWKECQKSGIGSCPLCRSKLCDIDYQPRDLLQISTLAQMSALRKFVSHPIHKGAGVVRCFLVMHQSQVFPFNQTYEMYIQAPCTMMYPLGPLPSNKSPAPSDTLLLVARKKTTRLGKSVIDIALDSSGFSRQHKYYMGRVESNFTGLEHTIQAVKASSLADVDFSSDDGSSDDSTNSMTNNQLPKNGAPTTEIGAILYAQNRIGRSVGPRRMQIALPDILERPRSNIGGEDDDSDSEWDDELDEDDEPRWLATEFVPKRRSESLLNVLKRGKTATETDERTIYAANSEPYWLDQIAAYSLDFQGRVTLPSNKNFQLVVNPPQNSSVTLQFGKVYEGRKKEVYTLDVQWPLTPMQAFGICLSACDRKLACA